MSKDCVQDLIVKINIEALAQVTIDWKTPFITDLFVINKNS